jgi:hypothetical protein
VTQGGGGHSPGGETASRYAPTLGACHGAPGRGARRKSASAQVVGWVQAGPRQAGGLRPGGGEPRRARGAAGGGGGRSAQSHRRRRGPRCCTRGCQCMVRGARAKWNRGGLNCMQRFTGPARGSEKGAREAGVAMGWWHDLGIIITCDHPTCQGLYGPWEVPNQWQQPRQGWQHSEARWKHGEERGRPRQAC